MTEKGKCLYYLYGKLNGQKKNPCFIVFSFRRLHKGFTTVYFTEEYARMRWRKASFGGEQAQYRITKSIRLQKNTRERKSGRFRKRFSAKLRFALVFRSAFQFVWRRVLVWRSAATPLVIDKHTPWCQIENKLAPVTFWYVTDTVFKCTDKLTNGQKKY